MTKAKIAITIEESVVERARAAVAAGKAASLSAFIEGAVVERLDAADDEFERLLALQEEVASRVGAFSAGDRLTRDELYAERIR